MRSYIKAIVIFNKRGEKRYVNFKEGVNIITGDSKTGKSALLEIIDYCLCSSRCTIPKGKITEFGEKYCIIMIVKNKALIISRDKWESGGKMNFSVEKELFSVESFNLDYFLDKKIYTVKDVQNLIEQELNLNAENIEISNEDKSKKASLRNMVSYMFQHQNLMASKFALFYRFSDFYKRQDIIQQFPIFAGYIGQEYYTKTIQLNEFQKKLKKLQKDELRNEKIDEKIKRELIPIFKDYYALVNKPFSSEKSIKQLKKLSENLPEIDLEQYTSIDIVARYNSLSLDIESLRKKEIELNLKINDLKNTNHVGYDYITTLNELKMKNEMSKPEKDEYHCPLCGNICESLNHFNKELVQASNWLDKEINFTGTYRNNFFEDIRKLENEKNEVIFNIKKIYREMKKIENAYLNSNNLKNIQDKISFAKARIELFLETIEEGLFQDTDQEIIELTKKITDLKIDIGDFNIDNKLKEAEIYLNNNMNKLAKTLDFEEEFKPLNLKFDIKTFDLFHEKNKQRIYLSEMGSGANWVSCHIVLFLSFLRLFAKQKYDSPMPLLLFFDQPSQVYFPQGSKKNDDSENEMTRKTDLYAVNSMYKTIFDEVEDINKDTGIMPQVIIVDHVDGEELEIQNLFESHTIRNWRINKALI